MIHALFATAGIVDVRGAPTGATDSFAAGVNSGFDAPRVALFRLDPSVAINSPNEIPS
jgi:hypothetical protein